MRQIIDLTHAVTPAIPLFPGDRAFTRVPSADCGRQGYAAYHFTMEEHCGTHVDAPLHFVPGGKPVDAIDAGTLWAPAVVIDVASKVPRTGEYAVSTMDLDAWEKVHGPIPRGAIVMVRTGWDARWGEPARYLNLDAKKVPRFPGLGADAARRIVARGAVAVGIDTLSLDPGSSTDFPAHHVLLSAGLYGVENLASLDRVPALGATVVVAPARLGGGTGAPARVLARLPDTSPGRP